MAARRQDVGGPPEGHDALDCDCSNVGAYLDGELSAGESASFESHVEGCPPCAAALAEQRRLLCLLDAALRPARGDDAAVPEDFARTMKARAQTDVRGLRRASERRLSLALVAALALLSLALVGAGALAAALTPLRALAGALAAVLDMTLHTAGEGFAGAAFVLRGFGRFLLSSEGGPAAVLAALACAALLLLRLVAGYHRARLRD
jgi:anti-sigma factor RsiW